MKNSKIYKMLTVMLALCMIVGMMATTVFAATIKDATIDTTKKASLTVYKYDFTNAAKDGVWSASSYVSTGKYDANVNSILGGATRKGASSTSSVLGNNEQSNGYAIKGVEFTYLKVAEPVQYSESANNSTANAYIEVLYKFDKVKAAGLLEAIGLPNGLNSYAQANALDASSWFYRSDVLNAALNNSLTTNATTVKNALESYVKNNGGTAMELTDSDGRTGATGMPLGLYLLVETKLPEMVTTTVNPFFVALPMTSINGGGNGVGSNTTSITDGGHNWMYDVTIYPKNETGVVTLEKTVREAKKDTGVHNGTTTDIKDGYAHNATASTGDTVEYQIISTLPTITSAATNITNYTFVDVLAKGITYGTTPLKIEWFTDAACTDKVTEWYETSGKFTRTVDANGDGSHTMTIAMTADGLAEINATNTSASNSNGSLYAGYSNYTIRITYDAILNSDASLVYGDSGNCNEVALTWKRTSTSYYDVLVDDCHVYSYGLVLDKDFSDGKDAQEMYNHVLFKVQNSEDGYYVQADLNAAEGIWYVTGHTTKEEEATAMYPVTWVKNGAKGHLVIKGLEDDAYILTEIETADGYMLLTDNIDVEITTIDDTNRACNIYNTDIKGLKQNDSRFNFDGGMNLKLANIPQAALAHNYLTASATGDLNATVMLNDEEDTSSTNALASIWVVNNHGFNLPQTGEVGAQLMPIVGGSILAIAMIGMFFIFVPLRKKEKKQ